VQRGLRLLFRLFPLARGFPFGAEAAFLISSRVARAVRSVVAGPDLVYGGFFNPLHPDGQDDIKRRH
jgi:hypothetical protein